MVCINYNYFLDLNNKHRTNITGELIPHIHVMSAAKQCQLY